MDAAGLATHTRYLGDHIACRMPVVQVPPAPFTGIVFGALLAADGALDLSDERHIHVENERQSLIRLVVDYPIIAEIQIDVQPSGLMGVHEKPMHRRGKNDAFGILPSI